MLLFSDKCSSMYNYKYWVRSTSVCFIFISSHLTRCFFFFNTSLIKSVNPFIRTPKLFFLLLSHDCADVFLHHFFHPISYFNSLQVYALLTCLYIPVVWNVLFPSHVWSLFLAIFLTFLLSPMEIAVHLPKSYQPCYCVVSWSSWFCNLKWEVLVFLSTELALVAFTINHWKGLLDICLSSILEMYTHVCSLFSTVWTVWNLLCYCLCY